jgi:hypothetical protein
MQRNRSKKFYLKGSCIYFFISFIVPFWYVSYVVGGVSSSILCFGNWMNFFSLFILRYSGWYIYAMGSTYAFNSCKLLGHKHQAACNTLLHSNTLVTMINSGTVLWVNILVLVLLVGVRLSPFGTSSAIWPVIPAPIDDDDDDNDDVHDVCWAVSGMSESGNQSPRREPAIVPLCPQIPHDLTCS